VRYKLDQINREFNAANKAVAKLKIVRPARAQRAARHAAHVRIHTRACRAGQGGRHQGNRSLRRDRRASHRC
jgi:hypothetical protein